MNCWKLSATTFLCLIFFVTVTHALRHDISEPQETPPIQAVVVLPPILPYPENLSFTPRIQQEEYIHATLSTPLIQIAPQASPPIQLALQMFLPKVINLSDNISALSWKLGCTNCTFNNLSGNFGVFDFCNLSQSTIQNSKLNFPRFIGGNLTSTKWHSVEMMGADFYGVIGQNLDIRASTFNFARFQEMDFTGSTIQGSSFTNCMITEDCILPNSALSIKNCIFTKCTMPSGLGAFLATQENVQIIDPLYVG